MVATTRSIGIMISQETSGSFNNLRDISLTKGQIMLRRAMLFLFAIVGLCAPMAWGDEAAPLSALSKMRVREVTVFKDGHALMLHEGRMPVDESGDVLM